MSISGEMYSVDNKKVKKERMKTSFELSRNEDLSRFAKNIIEKC